MPQRAEYLGQRVAGWAQALASLVVINRMATLWQQLDGDSELQGGSEERMLEAEAINMVGMRSNAAGEMDDALNCFSRAHQLNPQPKYALSVASVHLKLGNATLAISMLEELVNSPPKSGEIPLTPPQLALAQRKLSAGRIGSSESAPAVGREAPEDRDQPALDADISGASP